MQTTCPRCHNNDISENETFCWNCGLELGNCCDNPECVYQGPLSERNVVELPDNFTYCPYCGSQTRFAKIGFVKPLEFEQGS